VIKKWFDPLTAAVACLIALVAMLPGLTSSRDSREFFHFEVTLTSDTAGMTQLFWDSGKGMNEFESSSQPLRAEAKPVRYGYLLPIGSIRSLRFDPINRQARMTIKDARIADRSGRVIRTFQPSDFRNANQLARFEIQGDTLLIETVPNANDPVLDLPLAEPLKLQADWVMRIRETTRTGLWVLLLGLVVGAPVTVQKIRPALLRARAWILNRPGAAVMTAALLAVAVQSHPVAFFGRSFVSPNNGALMLYGEIPTLPGSDTGLYSDGMGSDVGAMLFQHLYYPMAQRDALAQGEWPLWNRYSLAGEPLLGQGQSMFGDPFNFLTIAADGAAWAWDLRFLLAHWLLAAGLGLTVLRLTRHGGAAVLVAIAGAFIGFYTFRIDHPATFSVCYSPWILWAWAGLIQSSGPRREVRWLGALIGSNLLVFTSGTMKEAAMLIACLNLAGLALLAVAPAPVLRRLRLLGLAGVAGAGLILMTAPLWLTFLTTWAHSYTGYDVPSAVTLPAARIVGLFDDIFYRQNGGDEHVVAPSLNALLFLPFLWALTQPRFWRRERAGVALVAATLVPLVFAFGILPDRVILQLPFIRNIVNVGNVFSCPLLVLTAVLSGFGLRDLLQDLATGGWWRRFALVLLAGTAITVMYFVSMADVAKSPFFAGYAASLGLGLVILPVGVRLGLQRRKANLVLLAVVAGLPLLLWRHGQYLATPFNHYAYVPGKRADFHAPSAAVQQLNALRQEPARVIGWESILFPSYNTALRWESIYGVDAVRSVFYQQLAAALGLQRVWLWDQPTGEDTLPRIQRGHDLLNVRYHLLNPGSEGRQLPGLRLLGKHDLDLYESPTAWPRAFFTNRVASYATMTKFADLVNGGDGRPFAAAEAPIPGVPGTLDGRTVRAATDYRLTSNTTSFTVEADGPGIAVLTEAYYLDDFQALLDGGPAPYLRVNHAFKAVAIPAAGRHTVTFRYWPQHFTLSLWLAAGGILLLGAGGAWHRTRTG
jgi:hypothetical protein